MFQSYKETSGKEPDFRIKYKWLDSPQKLFQHIRTYFRYADDGLGTAWAIWPEFENESQIILDDTFEVPEEGTATMWIFDSYDVTFTNKLKVGARGYLLVGSIAIVDVEVIELLGIEDEIKNNVAA